MKFRSKIGSGFVLLTLIWMLLTLASFLVWAVFGIFIPCIVFVSILLIILLPVYLNTNYTIKNGYLYIHFGLFVHQAIPCYNIVSITNSNSISVAPAISSIRLRLKFVKNGKIKSMNISPVDQNGFRQQIQDEIDSNFKKAKISQDQVDQTVLQNVLKKEQQAQQKIDEQSLLEQQKQDLNEQKQNSLEILKLEKRAKLSKTKEVKAEHLKAVRQANAEIEAEVLSQLKYNDGKQNLELKQLNELVSIHDKQEKEERKREYKLWAQEKKEKDKLEREKKKLKHNQEKQRKKLEKEAKQNIKKLSEDKK